MKRCIFSDTGPYVMKYSDPCRFANWPKSCSRKFNRLCCHSEGIQITYHLKAFTFSITGCAAALGMENKVIPDANISVSSQLNRDHSAKEARLNSKGGWSALNNNFNQWPKWQVLRHRGWMGTTSGCPDTAYNLAVTEWHLNFTIRLKTAQQRYD